MSRVRFSKKCRLLAGAAGALVIALPALGQELRGTLEPALPATTSTPASGSRSTSFGTMAGSGAETPLPDSADPFSDEENIFPSDGEARENSSAAENVREGEKAGTSGIGDTRALSIDAEERLEMPQRMNQRVGAIEGAPLRREENPYAPLGLRLGTFVLMPTLEQGLTWTSNADNSAAGSEAVLSETTLWLNATSDWSRHRVTLNGFGTFRKSLSGEETRTLEGGADATLDLELAGEYAARAALGYSIGREGASSPNAIGGVEDQPLRHTIDAALELEKALGKARFGIAGELMRNHYGDAELSGGGTLSQSDRNSTLALLRLRGAYEVSPALMPFVEVETGRRIHDEEYDSAGYARSATRLGARAGLILDFREKLTGEVSVGWVGEDFEDDRLETVSGISLAGNIRWSPMRGTIVGLQAASRVEGTTTPGESGSLFHEATLRLERALRSNLTGYLAFGTAYRDYPAEGHDLILSGEAALTWWLNRYLGLIGRARHERQTSNLPGRDYETTSFFMGMRLQR